MLTRRWPLSLVLWALVSSAPLPARAQSSYYNDSKSAIRALKDRISKLDLRSSRRDLVSATEEIGGYLRPVLSNVLRIGDGLKPDNEFRAPLQTTGREVYQQAETTQRALGVLAAALGGSDRDGPDKWSRELDQAREQLNKLVGEFWENKLEATVEAHLRGLADLIARHSSAASSAESTLRDRISRNSDILRRRNEASDTVRRLEEEIPNLINTVRSLEGEVQAWRRTVAERKAIMDRACQDEARACNEYIAETQKKWPNTDLVKMAEARRRWEQLLKESKERTDEYRYNRVQLLGKWKELNARRRELSTKNDQLEQASTRLDEIRPEIDRRREEMATYLKEYDEKVAPRNKYERFREEYRSEFGR